MLNIMNDKFITFFSTEAAAKEMAETNGGAGDGFRAVAAKGRPGKFVVEVFDVDDGYLLGTM